MRPFFVMILGRLALLVVIVVALLQGETGSASINSIVFVGSLFMPYLGKNDARMYYLDAVSMLAFVGFFVAAQMPFLSATDGAVLGMDKFFHVMGGACVAFFGLVMLEKRLQGAELYIFSLACVLIVGGVWEIFEYSLGLLPAPFYLEFLGWKDSLWDLVADVLGGIGVIILHRSS